ncbi:DNA-3-methyladenine glycosylase family protein [Methylobacterium iners]|uniref:DNA-3-methyladenine glycosylase II n=1 Tax=Methylobacterium iners TaxID=418707 RepID=A0ABQ4S182_9HYPH|nr:putative bifunctional transcriptional activator/DNA repair enzyme AlkA [Methylobacterium iners]
MLAYFAQRAIPGVEAVGDGAYRRTIALASGHAVLTVRLGEGDALNATVVGIDGEALPAVAVRLRQMFDLDADPAAIRAGLGRDPLLADLVISRPGLRVPGAWDGFELGVRAILGQQVSVAAATRLAARLAAAFGSPFQGAPPLPGLTHVFPTPTELAGADVAKALNMPRARGAAISALANAVAATPDLLHPGQGLEQGVARLKALRGIGEWTAQYIAMRAMREADAMPAGDLGLLRALDDGAGRPSHAQLLARSAAWRPWRAYATLHLWAHDAARSATPGLPSASA